jgi:hypothetical protein
MRGELYKVYNMIGALGTPSTLGQDGSNLARNYTLMPCQVDLMLSFSQVNQVLRSEPHPLNLLHLPCPFSAHWLSHFGVFLSRCMLWCVKHHSNILSFEANTLVRLSSHPSAQAAPKPSSLPKVRLRTRQKFSNRGGSSP